MKLKMKTLPPINSNISDNPSNLNNTSEIEDNLSAMETNATSEAIKPKDLTYWIEHETISTAINFRRLEIPLIILLNLVLLIILV